MIQHILLGRHITMNLPYTIIVMQDETGYQIGAEIIVGILNSTQNLYESPVISVRSPRTLPRNRFGFERYETGKRKRFAFAPINKENIVIASTNNSIEVINLKRR